VSGPSIDQKAKKASHNEIRAYPTNEENKQNDDNETKPGILT
jgi:hypothetical protein